MREAEIDIRPIRLRLEHVEAHQDRTIATNKLEDKAKLNIICDGLATKQLEKLEREKGHQRIQPLPACKCYLECDRQQLNTNEGPISRDYIVSHDLERYYMERHGWTKHTFNRIHWDNFGRARARNTTMHRYIAKVCCNWLPTNHRLRITHGISERCPW